MVIRARGEDPTPRSEDETEMPGHEAVDLFHELSRQPNENVSAVITPPAAISSSWRKTAFIQSFHLPELRRLLSSGQSRSWT
jgi:hypothetical protein